jgi:hypothetical protein
MVDDCFNKVKRAEVNIMIIIQHYAAKVTSLSYVTNVVKEYCIYCNYFTKRGLCVDISFVYVRQLQDELLH